MDMIMQNLRDILDKAFGSVIAADTLVSIISFALTFIILTGILVFLFHYLHKKETKAETLLKTLFGGLYWILVFILILVHFSDFALLNRVLFTLGDSEISLFLLLLVVFIVIFALKLSAFIRTYILPATFNKYQLDVGTQFTYSSIFHYVVLLIAILISLNTLGINMTSLTIFAGVIGVGIGFGMQNIISNFISGIILLFERPIKVGDHVILDGIIGDIVEIKSRATIVRSIDNEHIIVPNSYFLEERITNRSYGDLKTRITVDVGVSYTSDAKLVEKLLLRSVQTISDKTGYVLETPEPLVRFVEFGDSSLNFKLFVWVDTPANIFLVRSELHYEILEQFRENAVEIPFPQRDIHMKS